MMINNDKAVSLLFSTSPAEIREVYSGRHGCACGCRGNYNETVRQIKATLGKMQRLVRDEGATAWMSVKKDGTPGFIVVDTPNRTHTAYFA